MHNVIAVAASGQQGASRQVLKEMKTDGSVDVNCASSSDSVHESFAMWRVYLYLNMKWNMAHIPGLAGRVALGS